MNGFDTNLLFRASEHEYSSEKFHDFCDEKGSTITIIENEHGHVFGGYAEKSWKRQQQKIFDPNTFLFMIRPKMSKIDWSDDVKKGRCALWIYRGCGPVFGSGGDIYLMQKNEEGGCFSNSFEFD